MHDEYCDKSSHSFASPDWKGESWYRIMPPAGTQLADSLGPDHIQVKCSWKWITEYRPKVRVQSSLSIFAPKLSS